jgi:hypothetical protein
VSAEPTFHELVADLRVSFAKVIWSTYCPSEPVSIRFRPLSSCRARVWWQPDGWQVEIGDDVDDWKSYLLHELGHVAKGHIPRRIPEEVKAGAVDERAIAAAYQRLDALQLRYVQGQEREAQEWAEQERPRWR